MRGSPASRVRCDARRIAVIGVLLLVATAALPAKALQDNPWTYPFAAVEATGLKRIPLTEVRALAGLRVGRIVGSADVEAARQRLLTSGLFTSVGYGFRTPNSSLVVIFNVVERAWETRVVFDNFVDHTDAQLVSGVARDLPTFDGSAPDHDAVLKRIAASLERIARESKDPGTVTFGLIFEGPLKVGAYRFRLDRLSGPLPICAIDTPGIAVALQEVLRDKARSLLDVDYSREFVAGHARQNLIPILVAQGFPKARVMGVNVRREPPRPGCERGVAVAVSIDPGKPQPRPAWASVTILSERTACPMAPVPVG